MARTPSNEKGGLKKGPWTTEEDVMLTDYIHKHGPTNWRALPKKAGLQRCGKSCRLRWTNYLRPDIKRGRFSVEEEESIIQLHSVMGNKWSAIASKLPGRTDNEIKNYWNTHIRKRLLRMGIDPVTHGPRLDLLDLPSILTSLHHQSLLNIPTLLNLQTLINPELLKLATSLASSQNETSINTSFLGKTLTHNQVNPSAQLVTQIDSQVQNHPTFDKPNLTEKPSNISNIKTEQSCFEENGYLNAELSSNCYAPKHDYESLYQSNESNQSLISNNSSISSVFSSPCSSLGNHLDASLMYVNSSLSSEDEIDYCFFSNILKKLDNPDVL